MANEDELHRCVTEFMLDTCRYTAEPRKFMDCVLRAALRTRGKEVVGDVDIFSSGSSAEFYIKPVLSCIGDWDVMLCHNSVIVIPAGQTPPTQLPDHYRSIVVVYEIITCYQPGYVKLRRSCTLEKTDNKHYVAEKKENVTNTPEYLSNTIPCITFLDPIYQVMANMNIYHCSRPRSTTYDVHGPARNFASGSEKFDVVNCLRCLVWPPEAADWPTRSRGLSWPDSATINTVVVNGCDVVRAVHPSCKQDEWMSKYQWRLSFSRAEVTLINSWSPVQQIIYHMLRFVIKRELLTEEYEKKRNLPKLSNYHIKTLMLWQCEQKPQSWWSAESSLIKLCSSLLHKLSDCVGVKCCQQYFINNCNLLDHFMDYDDGASMTICSRLDTIADVPVLLSWFVKKYVLYSASVPMEFERIYNSSTLQELVRIATHYQVKIMLLHPDMDYQIVFETALLSQLHWWRRIDYKLTQTYIEELQSYDPRLRDYFVAATSLYVAYNTSIHSLTEKLLEILWTLFKPCNTDMDTNQSTSGPFLSISKAIKLARLNNVGNDALQVLYNEMSKAYLHHSFAYGQESTYCVVHILLATLCYKSGDYQAAIDHCKQVLKQSSHEQYGLHSWPIGVEYLPQIDESADAVIGLITFYKHVQRNTMQYVDCLESNDTDLAAFTIQLLARYLRSKCSTVVAADVSVYRQHLFHIHRLLLSDVLLFKAAATQLNKYTEVPIVKVKADKVGNSTSSSMDTSLLVTSLELIALEKLITVRQVMVRELHSEQFAVMNEFEALYAYKCGLFEQCLEMCQRYLNICLHLGCLKHQKFPVAFPQMLTLLDGDLVSLFGIVRLIDPPRHLSSFFFRHPCFRDICTRTLWLYLMVQCQKKLCFDMHDAMQLIHFVHGATDDKFVLDELVLKLAYRSLYISASHCST